MKSTQPSEPATQATRASGWGGGAGGEPQSQRPRPGVGCLLSCPLPDDDDGRFRPSQARGDPHVPMVGGEVGGWPKGTPERGQGGGGSRGYG